MMASATSFGVVREVSEQLGGCKLLYQKEVKCLSKVLSGLSGIYITLTLCLNQIHLTWCVGYNLKLSYMK